MQFAARASDDTEPELATATTSGLRPGPLEDVDIPTGEETPVMRIEELPKPDPRELYAMEAEWISSTLLPAGWRQVPASHDPAVSGTASHVSFSSVTLLGAILTIEYHPTQRALHLLVADSFGGVARLAMFYKDRLGDLLRAIVDHHQAIAMDRLLARIAPIVQVCPQTWWVGPRGALIRIEPTRSV